MRFFAHIAYKGSRYSGWQRQPARISVQQILEESLAKIFKEKITIYGCGRTDSGVHASQFFFHFDLLTQPQFDLLFRWNHVLPDDISVFEILPMIGKPHARFDATQRSYDYYSHFGKDPFLNDYSTLLESRKLNFPEMQRAVQLLPVYNDYRAFCKSPDKNEHTICHVSEAELFINQNNNRLRFYISSNRFLGRMIRILMKKLIEIGIGDLSVAEFEDHLKTKKIPSSIIPAPPQGLFLSKVTYPYLNLPVKSEYLSSTGGSINYWQRLDDC